MGISEIGVEDFGRSLGVCADHDAGFPSRDRPFMRYPVRSNIPPANYWSCAIGTSEECFQMLLRDVP